MNDTITDDDILVFQDELSQLTRENADTPVVIPLLKMMQPLGTYLGIKKDTAHADTLPVLNSIAEQLDAIIHTPDLELETADEIVSREIEKFKTLKNKIASRPEIVDTDMDDLKAVILSIDWEISDKTLENFESVLTNFLSKLQPYKIHHTFLKIIYTTGRFIGRQKADAPIDAISFLRSVFENFQKIVQTPDMAFKDKKLALETDIHRFHEFKRSISQKKAGPLPAPDISPDMPASSTPDITPDIAEDDTGFQPALSHVRSTGIPASDDIVPLTMLPDQDPSLSGETESDPDTMEPALADKIKPDAGPQDVMDDLFSIKESPADELLDAIHLMDVHGANQGQSMNMADQDTDLKSRGIKNFIPQQKDVAPIPEIGNRLDEFFNLDSPSDTSIDASPPDGPLVDASPLPGQVPDLTNDQNDEDLPESLIDLGTNREDEPEGLVPFQEEDESDEDEPEDLVPFQDEDNEEAADGIIPFDYEDESVESEQINAPEPGGNDTDLDILNRLGTTIEDWEWLRYEASMLSVNEDIAYLEGRWENDPDKTSLLGIIASNIRQLKHQDKIIRQKDEEERDRSDQAHEGVSTPPEKKAKGVWGKFKGIFGA